MSFIDNSIAMMIAGEGGGDATLITKVITANDTYNASDDDADGYSSVTVNVPNKGQINPFPEGASTITLYHQNGVTVTSSSIDNDGTGALNISEAQAGYEGMVVELNVIPSHIYAVDFDYQNINAAYWNYPAYRLGWLLENTARTDYESYTDWPENIARDSDMHHHRAIIEATGNKIYMNFNLCGYSDGQTNTAEITNLKVYDYSSGGVTVESFSTNQNGIYVAPAGKAYSPVTVEIPESTVEPLSVTKNGTYTTSGKAFSPVTVDVYEKYHELYTGGANMNPGYCYFNDTVNTDTYDELWIEGQYIYTDNGNKNIALWSGRYPTSVLYQNNTIIGAIGGHNHQWTRPNPVGTFTQTVLAEYDYPYAFFGVKNKDRTEDCLWTNTESTTPSTVTLSDSIFDYDEICLYFVKGDGATTTAWYLTDELEVNDVIQGYDDSFNATVNKYTIASNTTLTVLSEAGGYVLMRVYGVNDASLSETTLYTNPDPTTAPATVTLSESCANYDEIVLIGHIPSEDTICSQYYPVKILDRWTYDAYRDRIAVFSNQKAYWLTFTSNTTLVADANPTIIPDKIIGIKRPIIAEAVHSAAEVITRADWDLMTEAQKQTKGLVAIQDSPTGFLRGDFVNGADYMQSNKYIPYSDEYKIIGVAYPDLFDVSDNSWGYGTSPVLYTGTGGKPTLDTTENAVYFPTKTSDVVGYVDLGQVNTPFTAYIVMKAAASSPGRFLSCVNSTNQACLIMFSGNGDNVSIDNWGNGTDLGVSAVADYFVAAMVYTPYVGSGTGYGYVYNPANDNINSANKTVVACGRYLTIARTDINPSVMYPAPTDVYIKYIAVVNEVETSTTIENNLRALYSEFVGL